MTRQPERPPCANYRREANTESDACDWGGSDVFPHGVQSAQGVRSPHTQMHRSSRVDDDIPFQDRTPISGTPLLKREWDSVRKEKPPPSPSEGGFKPSSSKEEKEGRGAEDSRGRLRGGGGSPAMGEEGGRVR